jgi:type II secretory pathway component PulF
MPEYSYTARTKTGTIQKDSMVATNERAVAESLRAQGLMPTMIRPAQTVVNINASMAMFRRIKLLDKITFIQRV